jgi:hypothetical protein
MYYRIIEAPPGYGPDENYMVAAYDTADASSLKYTVRKTDGSIFFASTLEEARKMLPPDAKRVPFEPYYQSLELWEVKQEGLD